MNYLQILIVVRVFSSSLTPPLSMRSCGAPWRGAAVNILPVIARVADAAKIELRIVGRDEHGGLMERFLTNGSRSIPVVLLLDQQGQLRAWWGPRPSKLQDWFNRDGRLLPKDERYRELRRWYARDRGASIANEIADLIGCGSGVAQLVALS